MERVVKFSWPMPGWWAAAANYCLDNKTNLDEAEKWAKRAMDRTQGGQENFNTLILLSRLQTTKGDTAEAAKTLDRALGHPTATPLDIHLYGRQLLAEKNPAEALKVFEANAKRNPNVWPVHVGLARGYAANGRSKEALAEARLALPQAPDDANRKALQAMIQKLEAGETVN